MNLKTKRIIITAVPAIAAALVLLIRKPLLQLTAHLPPCLFHSLTSLSCPGCGNTRAAAALLSFDFIGALRYNISLPLLLVFAVLFYIEALISVWIKPVRLVPRSLWFFILLIIFMLVYFVVRNLW